MSYNEKSLKNLKPAWTSESAKEAQKNSVLARKANAEARAQLKLTMNEWKKYKEDVLVEADMSSIDVLKVLMFRALQDDDFDTAADLAKSLAEFEAPKLARVDQTTTEVDSSELSDEEIDAKLRELGLKS